MNNSSLKYAGLFILLIVSQVVIFSHINFAGNINPYIYIIFILLYPFNSNQALFLFLSFLLGISIDMFSDAGGINAAASLTAAYIRPLALRLSFGTSYEYQAIKIENTFFGERLKYIVIMVCIHHLMLFALEIFNVSQILTILKKTLLSGIFTIVISTLIIAFFSKKET